jgi:hypothetical protein
MSDQIKNIVNKEQEEKKKINKWREEKLEEELHVKYDPSKKTSITHLDAIMADVNEGENKVKDFLSTQIEAQKLIKENFASLAGLAGLSFSTENEAKKEKNHREELKRQREMKLEKDENKTH